MSKNTLRLFLLFFYFLPDFPIHSLFFPFFFPLPIHSSPFNFFVSFPSHPLFLLRSAHLSHVNAIVQSVSTPPTLRLLPSPCLRHATAVFLHPVSVPAPSPLGSDPCSPTRLRSPHRCQGSTSMPTHAPPGAATIDRLYMCMVSRTSVESIWGNWDELGDAIFFGFTIAVTQCKSPFGFWLACVVKSFCSPHLAGLLKKWLEKVAEKPCQTWAKLGPVLLSLAPHFKCRGEIEANEDATEATGGRPMGLAG